ncbi:MAG: 2OG-Fe(II) oxygenase [Xanthobacteraceae bacterium]
MSTDLERNPAQRDDGAEARVVRGLMPPHLVLHEFLEKETLAALLEFTLAHESAFAPSALGFDEGKINPEIRVSTGTRDFGQFKPILISKILPLVPHMVGKLRTTPVRAPGLELELVAHNQGAFYKRHIDTQTASDRKSLRVLSGVYYFHAVPKAFTGGELRLYAIGAENAPFVDIAPERNSLLVFPSWAPHEVRPISCSSGRFIDSRFAINCWVHRSNSDKT